MVIGVHQGSVLSPLLFAIVVEFVTENARKCLMKEVLYADDLALMSETMEGLKEKFLKWKSALERGLKVNLEKTKVMVCGSKGEVMRSKINPCGICGKKVTVYSVLCTKCDQWIYGSYFQLKKVTPSAVKLFACSKCDKATNGAGEVQQKVMCGEVETVKGFCYLGDRLNASGGCEATITARTRLGEKQFRECGEILFGKKFFLRMKGKIYKSYVRSTMLYRSKTWCLRENKIAILRKSERFMVRRSAV